MITVMRRHIKAGVVKWIVWFFLAMIGLFFALPNIFQREQAPQWVARIDDQTISYAQFAQNVFKQEANIQTIRQEYGAYADKFMKMLGLAQDPKELAFEQLIRETVLNKVAQDVPLFIDADYLRQKFNDTAFMQYSGMYDILPLDFFGPQGLNEQALRHYFARTRMNMSQLEIMAEKALARYIVLELAGGVGTFVPSYLAQNAFDRKFLKRSYAVLTLSLDDILKQERKKEVTDNELQAFYETQNKSHKRYWVPEMRSGTLWAFDPALYGLQIDEDDIVAYYEQNKVRHYVQEPSKVQVRRILFKVPEDEPKELVIKRAQLLRTQLLENPDTFADKAKELSEDVDSAQKYGLSSFFQKGDRSPAFERKAFLLKNDGDISVVFETEDGIELIQRVAKQPVTYQPLDQVSNEIRKTLLAKAFSKQFPKKIRKLLHSNKMNSAALEDFAAKHKAAMSQIEPSLKDAMPAKGRLFELKPGKMDFFIDGQIGYVVRLDEVKKRHLPPLEAIRSVVQEDFIAEHAKKTAHDQLNQMKTALAQASPAEVAKQFGAKLYETGFISPNDTEQLQLLKEKLLPVQKMFQMAKVDTSKIHADNANGHVLYLSEVLKGEPEEDGIDKTAVTQEVYGERKRLFAQGFIASLSRNATIETNTSLLTFNQA